MKKLLVVAASVTLAIVVGYKFILPALLLSVGRGAVDEGAVIVERVWVSKERKDFGRNSVQAGEGQKFVHVDCRIAAKFSEMDVEDFQLVKVRVRELGTEENVGDNLDRDHFVWTPLSEEEQEVDEIQEGPSGFKVRFSFKVPESAREGYLFYWGLYFGPLDLGQGR